MLEGVDYSDARPGGATLAARGKRFAVRYLYPPVTGGKGLSAAEVRDLQAHGIAIPLVYEGARFGMRVGHAQGVADAKAAVKLLKALPLDQDLPIYFAADWDATPAEQAVIDAYLAGAATVIGHDRVGLYGGYWVISRAMAAKAASWFWQTYAWSGGLVAPGIHLLQYSNGQWGGSVDFCRALRAEYGQHAPAPITPPITPPTPEEESGMYIKAENESAIYWFNRATGRKRHITPAEWAVAQLNETGGHVNVLTLPAGEVAAIANG